jgi:hypothetical protein
MSPPGQSLELAVKGNGIRCIGADEFPDAIDFVCASDTDNSDQTLLAAQAILSAGIGGSFTITTAPQAGVTGSANPVAYQIPVGQTFSCSRTQPTSPIPFLGYNFSSQPNMEQYFYCQMSSPLSNFVVP